MKETVKCLTLAMVLLVAVKISTQCSPPPPPSNPLTVEDRVQRAPIVVRGYLVRKIKDGTTNGIYKACLYITHVYKGSVSSNYICVGDFGSDNLCLVSLDFGVEYLIFLNGTRGSYVARYDYIHSAAVRFNDAVLKEIKNGICCPNVLGGRQRLYIYARLRFYGIFCIFLVPIEFYIQPFSQIECKRDKIPYFSLFRMQIRKDSLSSQLRSLYP